MRSYLLCVLLSAACSKSEPAATSEKPVTGGERGVISVPTSKGGPGAMRDPLDPGTPTMGGAKEDNTKLSADEGALTAEPPAECKAGVQTTAKVRLVPNKGYDVNLKYPFKLNLTAPDGVSLDKAALKGGGHDGAGDAETLELRQLTVPVKLVAAKAGDYSISGQFEFAICKEDACITKHVPVSLQIAAK